MAASMKNWGPFCECPYSKSPITRSKSFGVQNRAPDFWKLPSRTGAVLPERPFWGDPYHDVQRPLGIAGSSSEQPSCFGSCPQEEQVTPLLMALLRRRFAALHCQAKIPSFVGGWCR